MHLSGTGPWDWSVAAGFHEPSQGKLFVLGASGTQYDYWAPFGSIENGDGKFDITRHSPELAAAWEAACVGGTSHFHSAASLDLDGLIEGLEKAVEVAGKAVAIVAKL